MDEIKKESLGDLEEQAIACLAEICRSSTKDADRIAAAKLLLEHSRRNDDGDRTLTVVMEGIKEEYLR